jgi:hypothetical protein
MSRNSLTVFAALSICLMATPAWSQTATAPAAPAVQAEAAAGVTADAAESEPAKILVAGQRPGPGLWKVSRGEHVLWLFGLYAPLPKKMEWRSQEVETILSHTQEYLTPPVASTDVSFLRKVTLLPYAIGIKKNPDGAQLRDLLPADVYARWLPLRKKYLDDDDGSEGDRPIFVAEELFSKGLEQAGLSGGREVRAAIEKIVKKNRIKTSASEVSLQVDDPARAIKDFKKSRLDDVACFTKTLDRLETDIDAMRLRANAWARGDLREIQKLSYAERDAACGAAMTDSAVMKGLPGFQNVKERMRDAWLATAEKSLAANSSTFAVLQIKDILDPKGYVAALRAKGYTVDTPD